MSFWTVKYVTAQHCHRSFHNCFTLSNQCSLYLLSLWSLGASLQMMFDVCCGVVCRAYKTVQEEDLKFPLIFGEGKKVRRQLNVFTDCWDGHRRVISRLIRSLNALRVPYLVSDYHINKCSKTHCAQFITALFCKDNKPFFPIFHLNVTTCFLAGIIKEKNVN